VYKDPADPRLKEARMRWYWANKEKQLKAQALRRKEAKEWIRRKKLKCSRCGWDEHSAGLHFHHVDPNTKTRAISSAVHEGWSRKRLEEEIAKCVILCSNCHAVTHYGA
jgi:5-methylcytosine-specific restriction endonuclease McrA